MSIDNQFKNYTFFVTFFLDEKSDQKNQARFRKCACCNTWCVGILFIILLFDNQFKN